MDSGFSDSAGSEFSPLAQDYFPDTNGVSLDAHTMDIDPGGGWNEDNGDWDIQSNRANATGAGPGGPGWIASVDVSQADVYIKAIVNLVADGSGGIIFRFQDNSNLWLVTLNDEFDTITLFDRTGGSWNSQDDDSVALSPSTDYVLEVWLSGNSISAKVDGGNEVTATSAYLNTKTKHGLRAGSSGIRFDDFEIFSN